MFQMWRLMDWRVYSYDKISQWKANLMAISNRRILWSKVMLQINSGGRPSLSRFTPRVFHAHLLQTDCKGGNIFFYLFTLPSIHPLFYFYTSTVWTMNPPRQFSQLGCLQAQQAWPSLTLHTAIYPLIVDIIQYFVGWAQPSCFFFFF